MIPWKTLILLLGFLYIIKAEEEGRCKGGNCPAEFPAHLPNQAKCDCIKTHSRGCRITTQTTTVSPSLTTVTTTVPSTSSSCPIFTTSTSFTTTVQSVTLTSVITLSDSTTTRFSTVTRVTATTLTIRKTCPSTSHSMNCPRTNCNCPQTNCNCPQTNCNCPVVPVQTQVCPTCPINVNPGVAPVVGVCPTCPPLPTVTVTPCDLFITIIAHGPSPTSLNTSCLLA